MLTDEIRNARDEALKFITRADDLLNKINLTKLSPYSSGCYPKEYGALRRQSMELTRALAAMRNS